MLVSIIVPSYNQEKTILKDVKRIYSVMEETRWDFELILVSDGSSDKTLSEAKKFKGKNFHPYGYKTNKGKGYAVHYGMARAEGAYIAFIDSGMEIDPNGISMILEHMQWYDADIVVGSKRHPASRVDLSPVRKIYSWGYYLGVRLLFGLKVTDTQVGLKVFKRKVLETVLPRLLVKEFAFDIELLTVANHLGFTRIYDAPVEITLGFSEGSKIKKDILIFTNPVVRSMLLDTLAVFYRLHILHYYDDRSKQKWKYDKELELRVNTGETR